MKGAKCVKDKDTKDQKSIKKEGSMIDEYFNIYTEHIKEYGEKTAILYQCGSFLEMYEIDNNYEKIGNAKVLSNILNMK